MTQADFLDNTLGKSLKRLNANMVMTIEQGQNKVLFTLDELRHLLTHFDNVAYWLKPRATMPGAKLDQTVRYIDTGMKTGFEVEVVVSPVV